MAPVAGHTNDISSGTFHSPAPITQPIAEAIAAEAQRTATIQAGAPRSPRLVGSTFTDVPAPSSVPARYAGRTFQGYGEIPCSTPVMLRRNAVLPYHCPTGTVATSVIATCDNAFAAFTCAAGSDALTHCAVSSRASALSHQPNQPFGPRPLVSGCVAGVLTAADDEKVWNALQPPFSTGSVLARRCTTVPQSVSCRSTFMPICFRTSAVTRPSGWIAAKSVGLMTTTFCPAYPDAFSIFAASVRSPFITSPSAPL